jgi:hypothetical protein
MVRSMSERRFADGEDVYATDAPNHDVAHRPVLVHVPPVGSRKGFRARAFGAREREQHDHEEERELDLIPMNRHVDGGDDRENEAQRDGATRFVRDV